MSGEGIFFDIFSKEGRKVFRFNVNNDRKRLEDEILSFYPYTESCSKYTVKSLLFFKKWDSKKIKNATTKELDNLFAELLDKNKKLYCDV